MDRGGAQGGSGDALRPRARGRRKTMLTLIQTIAGRPWAIQAEIALHVRGLLAKQGIAGLRELAALKQEIHGFDPQAAAGRATPSAPTSIAVIPIVGTLTQRAQMVGSAETRSTQEIAAQVLAAAADPTVGSILLEVDSPGGEVFGVPEAFASIRTAAASKPIVSIANSVAASAGLYLASAASEFWVTPSGQVGSVGVYSLHVDQSKALDQMGEAWEFIVASKSPYKVEGNPTGPLTDEARRHQQAMVDGYMDMFVRDLAKARGLSEKRVVSDFGGGRMLNPTEALAAGMVDRIGTFEEAIQRAAQLAKGPAPRTRARAQAEAAELAAWAVMARVTGFEREN